ncbi:hypothetical protein Q8F55_004767 [Vanrija albida]|uniref:Major facilitator superfamily (MFS) profile domain-containing protein n=1 Tax=Vanrija albida TaxID=181172 RepID=A0ABR3PZP5_9TREE
MAKVEDDTATRSARILAIGGGADAISDKSDSAVPGDEQDDARTVTSRESRASAEAPRQAPLAPPAELPPARRWALTLIVMFSMAMNGGAQTGLNIALPLIQTELGISESNLQWVASAFALTNGCFLLLSGRVADAYGRKRCFLAGMAWYGAWCLVGSFMRSGPGLIVTRAMAGVGASMGIPSGMGIIAANLHGRQRATAFACFGAGAPIGAGVGMVLGGLLTAYASQTWRALLWIFTGLAGVIAAFALVYVPADKSKAADYDRRIDWLGAAMVTSGLVLLQFSVSDGVSAPRGWREPYVPTLFALSIVLIAAFFVWQWHLINRTRFPPLLSLALFTRARGRLGAYYFVGFVAWTGFASISYHVNLYYQQVKLTGPLGAVVRFLPVPVSGVICNIIVAQVIHRVPLQFLVCFGVACTGLSATFLAVSGRDTLYWTFPFNAMYLVVIGADFLVPTGSIFVSLMALPQEQSVAGALFQTLLQLGGSFGLTLTSVIATTYSNKSRERGDDEIDAILHGLQASFWLSAALAFTAFFIALLALRGIGVVSNIAQRKNKEEAVEPAPPLEKGQAAA